MELTILDVGGTHVAVVTMRQSQSILEVKHAIAASTGIPVAVQRLLAGSDILCNNDYLREVLLPGDAAELVLVYFDKWAHDVAQNWKCLRTAPAEIRNDRDIVLKAVEASQGQAIKYAGEEARSNEEIMLTAVQQDAHMFQYAKGALCTDFAFLTFAVDRLGATFNRQHLDVLRHWGCQTSEQLYAHKPFVLAVVAVSGSELKFAAQPLRADRDVVLTACSEEPSALLYAIDGLKMDRELVLLVLELQQEKIQNGSHHRRLTTLLKFVSRKCRSDRGIVMIAVQNNIRNLEYASPKVKSDCKFVLRVLRQPQIQHDSYCLLKCLSREARNDREIVTLAVQKCGLNLQYASAQLTSDRNIVALAVKQEPSAVQYATEMLQADHKFVMKLITESPSVFESLSCSCRANLDLALAAVRQFPGSYRFIAQELSENSEVAIAAVKKDWNLFSTLPPKLQNNHSVAMAAVHGRGCKTPDKLLRKMTVCFMVDHFLCQADQVAAK